MKPTKESAMLAAQAVASLFEQASRINKEGRVPELEISSINLIGFRNRQDGGEHWQAGTSLKFRIWGHADNRDNKI